MKTPREIQEAKNVASRAYRKSEHGEAMRIAYNESHKARRKAYSAYRAKTPMGCYRIYEANAKKRGVAFELTYETFISYWNQPCSYCAAPIATIGLDRLDNTKGYVPENVAPCCRICNRMKSNLPLDVFIQKCKSITIKREPSSN